MISPRATVPLVLLLLSGCMVGPDYTPPQAALPTKFGEGGPKSNGNVTQAPWWNAFRDSRLNGYVNEGLAQNLTVLQAVERINAAEANVIIAGAGGFPQLTTSADATISGTAGGLRQTSGSIKSYGGGATASWLLDFWGQVRRSRESATAQLGAAYANVDVARLALLNDVVSTYIDARFFQERIAISRENLKSRRDTLELTKFQLEAGAASRLDVVQAEGLVNSTLSEIPPLEINLRVAIHRLSTLLGLPASTLMADMLKGAPQPVARYNVNSGIPADLIRNRPDIRQAELQLASATADIGVAESQLFPTIQLSGAISPGHSSGPLQSGWLSPWSFGPTLVLPILDGGALRANVDIATSSARQQYLVWKQTVLSAVEEVENALAAVKRDVQTEQALRATVRSNQEALELSTASYKDGASSLLDVLDAQRNVSDSQALLAAAIQQTARDFVALNVAIGGGYAPAGAPVANPTGVSAATAIPKT
ncbi:efflux transporter outer membrane subunit [Rhizobiaceae bacterium n13]|uniref:Efflux transporter outer membrane subunit n=1 Tax=Ferirhizobium litorale TaxID=2927786 RepID=A0AAE3QEJ6_9HYPH|nr:efflux transporter outer membrane subunit [Fererhizobium litorale]MDI7861889.1 efflux transporter outer membrane subunit [Fererhizobium litorale]MDI7921769.1 efflux transporter outer membrane subunit [Fererhizobium litorale]